MGVEVALLVPILIHPPVNRTRNLGEDTLVFQKYEPFIFAFLGRLVLLFARASYLAFLIHWHGRH